MLLIVTNRCHCNKTDFHILNAGCDHPISPDTAALGVYLSTPRKNLLALFWTVLMHDYVLSPNTTAPKAMTGQTMLAYNLVKHHNCKPPALLHLAINRPMALLALCATSFAVMLKPTNSFKPSPRYLYLSMI